MSISATAFAGTGSKNVYNSDKTVYASTSTHYDKGALKDKVSAWGAVAGSNASYVTSSNPAKISFKTDKSKTTWSYSFYYQTSIYGKEKKVGRSNTNVEVTVTVDNGKSTYTVSE
jgi:hypothetical protein